VPSGLNIPRCFFRRVIAHRPVDREAAGPAREVVLPSLSASFDPDCFRKSCRGTLMDAREVNCKDALARRM